VVQRVESRQAVGLLRQAGRGESVSQVVADAGGEELQTPMLVVHGQLDYRLDVSEGFQSSPRCSGSRCEQDAVLPDEDHWFEPAERAAVVEDGE